MTQPSGRCRWRIMREKWERTYADGKLATIERTWVPEPGFEPFDTPAQAKRAYLEALDPAYRDNTDERMAVHWMRWQRNVGAVKLVRVSPSVSA